MSQENGDTAEDERKEAQRVDPVRNTDQGGVPRSVPDNSAMACDAWRGNRLSHNWSHVGQRWRSPAPTAARPTRAASGTGRSDNRLPDLTYVAGCTDYFGNSGTVIRASPNTPLRSLASAENSNHVPSGDQTGCCAF